MSEDLQETPTTRSERSRPVVMFVCYIGMVGICIWDVFAEPERNIVIRNLLIIAVFGPIIGMKWGRIPRLLRALTTGIVFGAFAAAAVAFLAAVAWMAVASPDWLTIATLAFIGLQGLVILWGSFRR